MAISSPSKSAIALKAFRRVADRWGLERKARATLLATSTRSIDRWEGDPSSADLNRDQLERISYVLGIYGGLHSVLGEAPLADEWVRRPNIDFGDAPPLNRMLAGNVGDLAFVRNYVDCWGDGG
jgi:hypothetical protein